MSRAQPELICHLAAQIDVRVSVTDPARDAQINVDGTVNVLEAARQVGARVLFASSGGALYGRDAPVPSGGGRAAAARVALRHRQVLRRAVHRPVQPAARHPALGAPAGQRVRPAAGPGRRRRGDPDLLRGRTGRARPAVYGDGSQTRDYVYVGDVVRAFLAAADTGQPGNWNIGTGVETSVLDLVQIIAGGVRPPAAPATAPGPAR